MIPTPDPRSGLQPGGSWEPAFPGQRPPFEAIHGAHSRRSLAPLADEIADRIRRSAPHLGNEDEAAVRLLAGQLARIALAEAHLDEKGLLRENGEPQPVLRCLSTWENSAQRLLTELGLVATSRAELVENLASAKRQMVTVEEMKAVLEVYVRAMFELGRHAPANVRQNILERMDNDLRALYGVAGDAQPGQEA